MASNSCFLTKALLPACLIFVCCQLRADESAARPAPWIGYTAFRTNLPGGRHANVVTMRSHLVRADGSQGQEIAAELHKEPNTWTQFAGWSPDGRQAIVNAAWESPENGAWEEEHKTFRFGDGWLLDAVLVDLANGSTFNITAVDRVSRYNSGLFFWPGDDRKMGFQALIEGVSHPFRMNRDGHDKEDLSSSQEGFTYGFNPSPDGKRICYHKDYQVYVADADGKNLKQVETGKPFNFAPQWSPDGNWVLFVAGEHYDCHPHVATRDGTGVRKIADRSGYRGVVEFLDVPDFHGGSSDIPTWSADGKFVYFTARVEEAIELFRVDLEGNRERLTFSKPGSFHYHPKESPDGDYLLFGGHRGDARQLYVRKVNGNREWPITRLSSGQAAMWGHWQPSE
ncbi:MAG: hypothetical protein U1D30_00020 [Planctomycetota bacterium]